MMHQLRHQPPNQNLEVQAKMIEELLENEGVYKDTSK
jgi:hypothetical protein